MEPRLPAWQRTLRHLTSVTFSGLPFEPPNASHIFVELQPLPEDAHRFSSSTAAAASSSEAAASISISSSTSAAEESASPAAASTAAAAAVFCSKTIAVGSAHPSWSVDGTSDLTPARAGNLRGVLLVVKQLAPRWEASSGAPPRVMWQRELRFGQLTHLYADVPILLTVLPSSAAAPALRPHPARVTHGPRTER